MSPATSASSAPGSSDAKFFYETDLKTRLEDRLPKFKDIVFHEKLGTQAERIERIERLAAELAPLVGADVEKAKRAARLCKADLLTEMVGEFPELQGVMGKYYAEAQGEDEAVAHAMRGSLQAERSRRFCAGRTCFDRCCAGGQDRLRWSGFGQSTKSFGSSDPFGLTTRSPWGQLDLLLEIGFVSVYCFC